MSVSDEDLDRYRQTLRHRDEEARVWQEEPRRRAWDDARRVASLLKEEFGAERVLLFGSVAQDERLSTHSDLDLAVEGLTGLDYYRAVARVQSISEQLSVDLVRLDSCADALRQTIEETGIEL